MQSPMKNYFYDKYIKYGFEENLRYSNGEPVKVVIADTTIGRVAEAAACEEKFRREIAESCGNFCFPSHFLHSHCARVSIPLHPHDPSHPALHPTAH